nr:hypothetical protein [Tanacetum cinerariifolium]
SRPEHLKTSIASLSIPGFHQSHHASSRSAGHYGLLPMLRIMTWKFKKGCWPSTRDSLKYLRRQLLEAVILLEKFSFESESEDDIKGWIMMDMSSKSNLLE